MQRSLWRLAALALLLVLALALRLYRLDGQSLWNDEGTSVALAARDLATITRNAAHDIHPPLYYYALHFWVKLWGNSEVAVRSLSALYGALTVLIVYGLARRLYGWRVAIVAGALAAISPLQVYYSQEARMYAQVTLLGALGISAAAGLGLYWFFRTELGTAMRAAGDNPQMIRALGVNVERYRVLGLALANGLTALSGALLAQYQGFADAQMGIGMMVWGLASVIIGESLTGSRSLGLAIYGAVAGSVLFRLLVAIALRWGLNPNDLKLVTALFVFAALVLPQLLQRGKRSAALAQPRS